MGYHYSDFAGRYLDYRNNQEGAKIVLENKLLKHLHSENEDKLIAYFLAAFQHWNPDRRREHPNFDLLDETAKVLKSKGYAIRITAVPGKEYGKQIIVSHENDPDHYHHSNYKEDWPDNHEPTPLLEAILYEQRHGTPMD